MDYSTVKLNITNAVARVTFCRPEIHNAFNSTVIKEMADIFSRLENEDDVRVVILTGEGKSFCAGADLNWMRSVVDQTYDENLFESNELAKLFYQIYSFQFK